jgi:hypothetical protein
MRGWGYFGFTIGALIGALLVVLFLLAMRPPAGPTASPPNTISPDVTVFLSEQSLSRMASETLNTPTAIDFDPNGQMRIITRTNLEGLEPVVQTGLLLELQGTELVSRLQWVRLGFLTIPADWLPPEALETTAIIGQTIEDQIPPDFSLVGVSTDQAGVNFQLKWIGQ